MFDADQDILRVQNYLGYYSDERRPSTRSPFFSSWEVTAELVVPARAHSKGCRSHFIKLERGRRICIFCHHRSYTRVVLGYWVLNFYWSTLNIELGGCFDPVFVPIHFCEIAFCQCFLRERNIEPADLVMFCERGNWALCDMETWEQINFYC